MTFDDVAAAVTGTGEIGALRCGDRCHCWKHAVLREGVRRGEWVPTVVKDIWAMGDDDGARLIDGVVTFYKTSGRRVIESQLWTELAGDLLKLEKRLKLFAHLERFGGCHHSVLARLYQIGREACLSIVTDRGSTVTREEIADGLIGKMPAYDHAVIDTVGQLYGTDRAPRWVLQTLWFCRPFYVRAYLDTGDVDLPFDPNGPDSLMPVANLRESVSRLVELAIAVRRERLARITEKMN